jgi:hypothetical protein
VKITRGWIVRDRLWVIAAVVLVAIAVVGGAALGSRRGGRDTGVPILGNRAAVGGNAEIPVDQLATAPDKHLGRVTVAGSISSIDTAKRTFVLGCADACVGVPVQFNGTPPKAGTDVVVEGAVSKGRGGTYVLVASDVRTR